MLLSVCMSTYELLNILLFAVLNIWGDYLIDVARSTTSSTFFSAETINLGVGGSVLFWTARALRLGCLIVVEAEDTHVFLGRSL